MARTGLTAVMIAALSATPAIPQSVGTGTDLQNTGDCNANTVGSNNTITINCYIGQEKAEDDQVEHLVVLTLDTFPTVQTWQYDYFGNVIPFHYYPNVVNFVASQFSLTLGDETQRFSLADTFQFRNLRLSEGEHAYAMQIQVTYWNGFTARTQCAGIIDLQSSATLIPKMHIAVDPNVGNVAPLNCNFIAQAGG